TAAASAFAVVSMGNAAIRVDSVAVSGKTVTLTLSRTVAGGETVKLKYTKPETGDNVIQDVAGNDAASFMDRAVSNLVPDTTAPVLDSATVHSNQLVLIYIDAAGLDALKTATSSAFAVSSAGNAAISVNSVAVVGKTVTLMLSRAVAGGEALNLSYTRPATGDNVIQDAAGNAATSFTDRDVLNLAQDGVAPVFRSATVRGNQLVLTYTDATDLNAEQTAAASAFVVLSAGNAAISVNSVLVSGKTVTLTLSREVAGGEALDLDYIRPETGENVIQDAAGNPAVSFWNQAVSNLVLDTTVPVLGSAAVHGTELTLTYIDAGNLDAEKTAAASAFAVSSAGNAALSVSRVIVSGKTVTLTLSRAVDSSETLKLSYTRPATSENVIQDAAGNDAASFTDQAVVNRVPDTTAPVLGSATVNGDQLVLTYIDVGNLNVAKTAAAAAFAVSSAGNATISVNSVLVSGKTVTLTLSRAVASDETLNLSYTRPATGENAIQDAAGNAAASFTDQAVVNRVLDTTAPVLGSATVHGDELVLTYTDAGNLDAGAGKTAAASAFAVSSAGNEGIRVNSVAVTGKTVTLTLSRSVAGGEVLKLSYTRPPTGENVIQDVAGNDAASFTNQAVRNLVPDTTAPVLGSATVNGRLLELSYTDAGNLDAVNTAAAAAFALSSAGNAAIRVNSVAVTGKTVTLTLSRDVISGETLKLSYTRPETGENVIQDATGNEAASFMDQAVQVRDTTAPVLGSATVNGKLLVLSYTDVGNLDAVNTAAASAFAVSSAGKAAIRVNSVLVLGKTVILELSREVASDETPTLSYTKPATGENVIQDAAGNDAASFTDQAVQVRDITAPVLGSATVNGNQLVLSYTDAGNLDAVNTAAASAFAVSSVGNAAIGVNRVLVSGKTVILTLSRDVARGETLKLSYTRPATGENVIQDVAGNDAASFRDRDVQIRDTTAPVLGSATVDGKLLELTYIDAGNLDAVNTAAASAFVLSSPGNTAIRVDRVLVSGKTVTLLLSRKVVSGEAVTLSYTRPATGDMVIQDAAGNDAASFTNQAVSNNRAGDTMAPVFYSATVRGKQLVLSYTDATDLDAVRTAAASAFAVSSAGNAAISVDRVVVSGKTVTLTLSRDVVGGETVKLSYTRPPTGDNVIQDAAGNDAASFTDQAVSNLVPDTTAPVLASATVRGDKLDLTYTDAGKLDADAGKIAAASAFAVSSVGNAAISVSNVSVMDKTVTLTLSRAVAGGETVKLSYTRPPTGDNVIQDAAGNDAASFTNQAVSNLVRDTTAPVLASATVSGRRLVLSYTDVGKLDTDAGKIVAASAFAVSSVDNAAISVSSVAVSDKTVTLTLSRSVAGGETVKLSYTRPTTGDNVIQDATGNDAASFMDQAVSNLVPDTTAPVLGSATVNGRLLVLTYTDVGNLDTDAGKIVAASAFAVSSVGNEAISVSSVAVSGKTVTLALSRSVAGGETVKLSYTRPTTGDNVIQDAVGNDAASFTDQAVSNLVPDITAPVLASATVNSRLLVLTYTDVGNLNVGKIAAASAFAVSSAGNEAISVNQVIVSGQTKTVTLMLSRDVAGGEMLQLSYTRPATGGNGIQDAAGNDAASFTDQAVRNLVRDTTAPVLGSATVNGLQLVLTYTDVTNLDIFNSVAASTFALSSAGNLAISVSSVVVEGKTVTLTLSRYVHGGETVKLSYTKPATGGEGIQDWAGNGAASFTDQAVSNLVRDTMAPVL
ncbi:hypothetical protein D8B22_20470, partial [Verminephrobacter aporrectodeae subsp. tuberculatae]